MTESTWDSMVTVGLVIRPQGNRGEVVVRCETDYGDERFAEGMTLNAFREGRVTELVVAGSREHRDRWVVHFAGVGSIDDAEGLRGLELRIPHAAVKPLEPGGYYVHDLVECEVVTTQGELVGRVERVDFRTGVPMLVVAGGDETAEEVLVPLADDICRRVDVGARRITVDPPAGLLELNRRPTEPRR